MSLSEAIDLALAHNEQAALADNDVLAADARVAQARSYFWPQVGANGSYVRRAHQVVAPGKAPVQRLDALNATAQVNQALVDVYSLTKLHEVRGYSKAARLQGEETKRRLAFEVAQAFFAVLAQDQKQQAAKLRAEFANRSLADAQARFAAQLVGTNDVTLAQLEQAAAKAALAETTGAAQVSLIQLSYLVATTIAPPLVAPDELTHHATRILADDTGDLVAAALRRRPDVRAHRLQLQAAQLGVDAPPRRLIPTLGAQAYGRATNETGFSGRTLDGFVGLNLTWSIFDGGLREADQALAQTVLARTDLQAAAVRRQVATDIEAAWALLHSRQAALEAATEEASAASRNADETRALYHDGLTYALAVENASTRLFSAHVALAEVRYRLTLAYLDMQAALGLDPLGREPTL